MPDANSTRPAILIGRADGDHLSIQARGRLHADADDYWDGSWLICLHAKAEVGASDGVLGSSGDERPLLGGQPDLPRLRRAVDPRVIPVCSLPANHGARRDPQGPPGARARG
jgi:hypothetical protein